MLWRDEKIKISMEIQKSYQDLKIQENQLTINQILRQLQAFAEKIVKLKL